jgi:hypothetical protein
VPRQLQRLVRQRATLALPEMGLVAHLDHPTWIEGNRLAVSDPDNLRSRKVDPTEFGSIIQRDGNPMRAMAPFAETGDAVCDVVGEVLDDGDHAVLLLSRCLTDRRSAASAAGRHHTPPGPAARRPEPLCERSERWAAGPWNALGSGRQLQRLVGLRASDGRKAGGDRLLFPFET